MSRTIVGLLAAGLACSAARAASDTSGTIAGLDKKLIQYGWGIPTPDFIRTNLREMEKRPFDGLIFQLRGGRNVLTPTRWDEAKFAGDYENLRQIKWEKFTDNFVIMLAASKQDWFSDEDWQAIEHNTRLLAKGARIAGCVGVCFDQEPYGFNPWAYTRVAHRDTKSFAEYEAIARRRGSQFIRAVESELPGAQILTFFQLSYFSQLLVPMKPAERQEKLSQLTYSLLPAFLNGMLDAAGPDVRTIDGNEGAYYYTDSRSYFEAYHRMKQRGLLLVDPKHWAKYRRQVQAGHALYIDQYFGLRTRKVLGHYLSPEGRAKWFEHNAYWALHTTDKYVWCYSEKMHWFRNESIPPGCEAAIRSARQKLAQGRPLGIDLKAIVERGHKQEQAALAKRLKQRTTDIARLPADTPRPKIDGRLDDAAWTRTKPLAPLVALATRDERLKAQTQAWVTYDNTALFVAVRCQEPAPQQMHIIGKQRDDDVWLGDDVEVMVAAPGKTRPFYHFMLNPRDVLWDAVHTEGGNDRTYNPDWEHGTQIGSDCWMAEMAIPWAAMDMKATAAGTKLRANICRQRMRGYELSAWSPMVKGFLEHELFGTWVFR